MCLVVELVGVSEKKTNLGRGMVGRCYLAVSVAVLLGLMSTLAF